MTTNSELLMRQRFESVAGTVDDSDWDDVIARAGLTAGDRVGRRAVTRRAVVVAVFAAFVLGIGATLVSGAPFRSGSAATNGPGPAHVQRPVPNGTIAWLFHHQPRGESLASAHIAPLSLVGAHWQPTKFARVLVPDPAAGEKIAVSLIGKRGRNICMTVVLARSGFGGCAIGLLLKPFNVSTAGGIGFGTGQKTILAGLASDDVARMVLFLAHDRRRPVPLEDNAFFVTVAQAELPANLVAYDHNGLVIGITRTTGLGLLATPPARAAAPTDAPRVGSLQSLPGGRTLIPGEVNTVRVEQNLGFKVTIAAGAVSRPVNVMLRIVRTTPAGPVKKTMYVKLVPHRPATVTFDKLGAMAFAEPETIQVTTTDVGTHRGSVTSYPVIFSLP
jgi:hypothetical protein